MSVCVHTCASTCCNFLALSFVMMPDIQKFSFLHVIRTYMSFVMMPGIQKFSFCTRYTYKYVCVCVCVWQCFFFKESVVFCNNIFIEGERGGGRKRGSERKRESDIYAYVYIYTYVFIFIHVCIT